MASTSAGTASKGDCRVVASWGSKRTIRIETKAPELLASGIRAVAERTLDRLAAGAVELDLDVDGALDYVIGARIEAAVRALTDGSRWRPDVRRAASNRDRPRRSRLYVPGNHPRLLVGVEGHGADCVLLDLEDSVPPGEKAAARILVKHLLAAVSFPEEVWVRINPLQSEGGEDLAEVLLGRPHGICLPKAERADDVRRLGEALQDAEATLGAPSGSTWIMPIVETAGGVLHAEEIAAADQRVVALAFGAEDFTRDINARRSHRSLLFARSRLIAASAAAGIQASDTVFSDLDDDEGLIEEAQLARELGFDGKGAINPRQLPALHAAFTPSEEELDQARAIVEAAERAESAGIGAVSVNGRMVDRPVLERAKRLIRDADRLVGRGRHA